MNGVPLRGTVPVPSAEPANALDARGPRSIDTAKLDPYRREFPEEPPNTRPRRILDILAPIVISSLNDAGPERSIRVRILRRPLPSAPSDCPGGCRDISHRAVTRFGLRSRSD